MVSRTTVGILGGTGFLGSNLFKGLNCSYPCTAITKPLYAQCMKGEYKLLVNANGNSKKYLPNTDPLKDFELSVKSTLQSILDFKYDLYVYISSCEVYEDLHSQEKTKEDIVINPEKTSRYGLSKYLSECLVRKYCPKWLILRLNGPINVNAKKGPVFDILNRQKLWVSGNSEFQFLHTDYITSFLNFLISNNVHNEVFNLTGRNAISLIETMSLLGGKSDYPDNPVIRHNINIDKANAIFKLPTSAESILNLL